MKALYPNSLLILIFTTACTQSIHAPTDFALRIEDYTETIDTFRGTYTRRGIAMYRLEEINRFGDVFRDTTIQFAFSPEQKDSIYQMIGDTHFFILPEVIAPQCTDRIMPSSTDNLFARCNSVEHKVIFENGCETADSRVKEFQHLLSFIDKMVHRNPKVKALPDSKLFRL